MGRAGGDRRRAVHGRPRRGDRQRGVAVDQDRPALQRAEPAVGDHGVLDRLRRSAATRWPPGRHSRPTPALRRRPRPLHDQLAARRPCLVRGLADRVPLAPGTRRGAAVARGPLDPDDDVQRGTRAQHRTRRLGRGLGKRRRRRRAARRCADERVRLVVDLLRQRPGRSDRARRHPVAVAREQGRPRPSHLRLRGSRVHHGRAHAARLCAHPSGATRLGHDPDDRAARRVRRPGRRVRGDRAPLEGTAPPARDLQAAHLSPDRTPPASSSPQRSSRSSSC